MNLPSGGALLLVQGFVLCVLTAYSFAQGPTKLPSWIKPCKADKFLNECGKRNGIAALPFLLGDGHKELKLPRLNPLNVPLMEIDSGESFKLTLINSTIYGLETAELRDYRVDLNNMVIDFVLFVKKFEIHGDYKIKGKLSIIALDGEGPAQMRFDDINANHTFRFKLVKRKGIEYMASRDSSTRVAVSNAWFKFDNLFGGNEQLGKEINQVLNDNVKAVLTDLMPGFEKIFASIAQKFTEIPMETIPYKDIYLQD